MEKQTRKYGLKEWPQVSSPKSSLSDFEMGMCELARN
jgi:hypothetical protein